MSARIEMEGQKYGAWTVLEFLGRNTNGQTIYRCRCACGTERVVVAQPLREGKTVSCGCLKSTLISDSKTTHGESYTFQRKNGKKYKIGVNGGSYYRDMTPERRAWISMLHRCSPNNTSQRARYYERGITVCHRWASSYENFLADMGPVPRPGFELNRIDNNGIYEPSNCNWADAQEQANNRS